MEISTFIEKFKEQLEDVSVEVNPEMDYIKQSFWDSLTSMVVKIMIEDEYEVDVAPEKMSSFKSVQELFNYVKSQK